MIGITAFGGYLPRLRLSRESIVAANAWMNPALAARRKGERAMCNWDEDSLTMAVEAARDCLAGRDRATLGSVYLASTTLPFADRQCAGVLATALNLDQGVATMDVASSQRAGVSALMAALQATTTAAAAEILVVAADHRRAKAASMLELLFGDGAAAVTVGAGPGVVARYLAGHALSVDFVDHYRGQNRPYDYTWEERWVRDEGYMKIVPQAIAAVLEKAGLAAGDIDHVILPTPFPQVSAAFARSMGFAKEAFRDTLHAVCGETGAAHPLLMLGHALEAAAPGHKLLVLAFGQGCDALLFEATEALPVAAAVGRIGAALGRRKTESNYHKYLSFNDLVTVERGIRAESNPQTALSTLYRKREMIIGLVGGRCRECGTVQFPKTEVCVSPNCNARHSQDDEPFADRPAKLMSWSADWLTYTADPPAHYGMVEFEGGGRFMADITDHEPGAVEVGMPVRMVFRIKHVDEQRGFTRYFWKAAPVTNARQEG